MFSIAICRLSGDKWQSKTLFLTSFDLRSSIVLTFSITAYSVWKFWGNVKYVFSPIVYTNITEECYFSQMYIAFDRFHSAIYYGLLQSEQGADPDIQCIR